jgi:hypothetical protein
MRNFDGETKRRFKRMMLVALGLNLILWTFILYLAFRLVDWVTTK